MFGPRMRGGAPAFVALAATLALAGVAQARARTHPARLTFAEVPWGTPADELARKLAPSGFKPARGRSPDSRFVATGRFYERFAVLEAQVDDRGRLVRIVVSMLPKAAPMSYDTYTDMRGVYDEVVASLLDKHGPPDEKVSRVQFPYWNGQSEEDHALRDHKADIHSLWKAEDGDQLRVEMDDRLAVKLTWTAGEWVAFERRTRQRHAKDL
ncbi:MAG TPA: hypothetical protein VFK69_06870 [Candidatus Eisenbacteria bacterium]|nr:hypothetical protein [Candidatus Eisenbacteria bacterium]